MAKGIYKWKNKVRKRRNKGRQGERVRERERKRLACSKREKDRKSNEYIGIS